MSFTITIVKDQKEIELQVAVTGPRGLSAYAVAVANGFVGDVAAWLASLVGDEGASAYAVAVANGFVGSEAAWLASLQGDAGLSAYEIAVANGFVGNEAAWLASLVGDEGASAYAVAVANGFVGDVAAWLASLQGAAGAAGNSLNRPFSALTSSSGVVTVDLSSGDEVYELALTENVTSWSFTNLPASGFVAEIRIDVVQHASAAKTCVSPATAGTAGGAWTVSETLSARESLGVSINSAGARQVYPSGVLS